MENTNFLIPKDGFSELFLSLAKDKHLFELKQAKSNLFIKETLNNSLDDYSLDTFSVIDESIKAVEEMGAEEFLTYMFSRIKGEHLFKVNYDELFNMLEVILPKPTFFVDRGYER